MNSRKREFNDALDPFDEIDADSRTRMAWAREQAAGYFLQREITLAHLVRQAPLVARELQRQGRA